MSKEIKQRREQLSSLVARMENVMTDLVRFHEQSLDDAITSLNNHEGENL